MTQSNDYTWMFRVEFFTPPASNDPTRTEYYFSSLAAIYTVFTSKETGCTLGHLWNNKIREDNPYNGRRCRITKEKVYKKAQKKR